MVAPAPDFANDDLLKVFTHGFTSGAKMHAQFVEGEGLKLCLKLSMNFS